MHKTESRGVTSARVEMFEEIAGGGGEERGEAKPQKDRDLSTTRNAGRPPLRNPNKVVQSSKTTRPPKAEIYPRNSEIRKFQKQ